jgi:hypothetical protein
MRAALLFAMVSCLFTVSSVLAEHAPGDSVRVRWAGQEVVAEVVSVDPKSGWIKVKFQQNGMVVMPTLPPQKIFATSKEFAKAEDKEHHKRLEQLRTNSDGKNVSSKEYRDWHEQGKAGKKLGRQLFTARVKAYRAGFGMVIFETKDRKELLLKIEQISNTDRGYLFDLLKASRK